MNYQLVTGFDGVLRVDDNVGIPNAPGNRDWDAYQEWLTLGNTPLPAAVPVQDPRLVTDQQELQALKQNNTLMTFINMTPAQIDAWIAANVNNLADARNALSILAKIANVAIRRVIRG